VRALLTGLALLLAAPAQGATPLLLAERQIVTLEFARPVARLATTDPDVLVLEPAGARLRITAVRAGRAQVEVAFDDGATASFEVTVEPARRPAAAGPAAAPAEVALAVGETRRLPFPGLARVLAEDNGVIRVRTESNVVVVTGVIVGRSSVVLQDGAGTRTTVPVRVHP
jgi:hypothetical protein